MLQRDWMCRQALAGVISPRPLCSASKLEHPLKSKLLQTQRYALSVISAICTPACAARDMRMKVGDQMHGQED